MTVLKKIICLIFGEPENTPPWVKGTSYGKLYIDRYNKDYIRFKKDQIKYMMQWSLVNGKMMFNNDKGLTKPNIKDYYE